MSARSRRGALLGALLGSVLILKGAGVAARYRESLLSGIDEESQRVLLGRQQIGAIPTLSDSVGGLEERVRSLPHQILAGRDEGLAVLDLSRRITLAATEQAVSLDSIRPVADAQRQGRLQRVAVKAFLETDASGLGAFLATLEKDGAVGFQHLTVTATNPMEGEAQVEVLDVDLLLTGWFSFEIPDTTVGSPQV